MGRYISIVGKVLIGAPNYAASTFVTVTFSGGDWENTDHLDNLNAEFFIDKTISIDAAEASTRFDTDLGAERDIKIIGIPNSTVERTGEIAFHGSDIAAWSGITITGVEGTGETTINVTATGQAYFQTGEGFSIAGDTQVYQITTGISLGENKLTRSEEFDDVAWTKTNATIVADNDEAPDDTTTMDRIVETVTSGVHEVEENVTDVSTGIKHTFDVFVRAAERTKVRLILNGAAFIGESVEFDLTAATATNGPTPPDASNIEIIPGTVDSGGNSVFRISITATASASGIGTSTIGILDEAGASSYAGDITKGLSIWGAQFVVNSTSLQYVKSEATIITASSGDIIIERVGDAGTGLVVATTGGEIITTHSGDYIANRTFSSGLVDYFPVIYGVGERVWGQPGVWDGKEDPEIISETNLPNQFIHINSIIVFARYVRTIIKDTTNTAGFITIDAIFITSAYEPTFNMSYGATLGTQSNSTSEESAGGVIAFNEEVGQRVVEFILEHIDISEAFANSFDLNRRLDITDPFYFVFDADATNLLNRQSFPALFDDLFANNYTSFNKNAVRYRIKEKLG